MSLTQPAKPKRRTIQLGLRNSATLAGESLDEWSDEELQRGQRKSRRGTWEGRPPKVVPKRLHDELVRRQMSKANELLRDNLVGATEILIGIAQSMDTDDAVRLKAATIIMERVLGKTPEKVEVSVQRSPFETSLDSVFVTRDVIDVEPKDDAA